MTVNDENVAYQITYNWKGEKNEDNPRPIPPQNDVEDIMAIIKEN